YLPSLTFQMCRESVEAVLNKREAQHAILTGLALDQLAEEGLLPSPLQEIIARDEPLYGVDEILALAITNIYGSVGLTSFGYLAKRTLGIIGRLNRHAGGRVNACRGGLAAGIAAGGSARLAHQAGGAGQEDPAQQAAESAQLTLAFSLTHNQSGGCGPLSGQTGRRSRWRCAG